MEEILLFSDYLTLGQALKEVGVISTGGQAKFFLSEQTIWVNGEPENRRGRKLYTGDQLTLPNKQVIQLRIPTPEEEKIHQQELAEKKKIEEKVRQLNQKKKRPMAKKNAKPTPRFPGVAN